MTVAKGADARVFDGIISERARRKHSTVITRIMARALDNPDIISLAAGFVDQASLPVEESRNAMAAVLGDEERGRAALQYGRTVGDPELRELIAERLRADGVEADPECMLLTAGSQQQLFLLNLALLDDGDIILVEDPTYFVYSSTFNPFGVRAMGVRADEGGMVPELLEQRLSRIEQAGDLERVKGIYVMPDFANPSGSFAPVERREAIYEIAKSYSRGDRLIPIIEDAAYRQLRFDGPPAPPIKSFDTNNEMVALIGSFSKAYAPGVRVAWGLVPPTLFPHLVAQKTYLDFGSPNLNQKLVLELMRNGGYDRHVAKLRKRYQEKRDMAMQAIEDAWPRGAGVVKPQGGLYVWAETPEGVSTSEGSPLFEECIKQGVLYVPGNLCYVDDASRPIPETQMRICYGMIEDDKLVEGLKRLGQALAKFL